MRAHALALIHRSYPIARAMEGGPRKKTSGTGQSDPSTLFLESDFNFDGLETQNPNELSDSGHSDSDSNGSDIQDAIMAQLYFHDVQAKKSGKRVSVAKQLGSSEIVLDKSADGSSFTSISFVIDNQRKRKRRSCPVVNDTEGADGQGVSSTTWRDTGAGFGTDSQCQDSSSMCGNPSPFAGIKKDMESARITGWAMREEEMGEEGEEEDGSRCVSVRKKYHLNRTVNDRSSKVSKGKNRWGKKSLKSFQDTSPADGTVVTREVERGGDSAGQETFVGVREMEEWDNDSSSSSESRHSSDMDLSDPAETEGQLFLEVDEKDKWHIILKDVMGRDAYEKQYGGRVLGRNLGKCFNCKQKGQHKSNSCPHPIRHQVCYICSGYDHISSKCREEYCTYCFQKKHKGKPCSTPWGRYTVCQRCYGIGHHESICHERWRQYHNTTNMDNDGCLRLFHIEPRHQIQTRHVFCYNCARKGHFGHECSKERPRGFPTPLTPHIAAYDDNTSHSNSNKRRCTRLRHDDKQTPNARRISNCRKGDGLLETPTTPQLPSYRQERRSNGHWREQDTTNSYIQRKYNDRHRVMQDSATLGHDLSNYRQDTTPRYSFPSPPPSALSKPPLLSPPWHPNTPNRSSGYGDCEIVDFKKPQRTMSVPHPRRFAPERRFSHDPSHLRHEELDFPRTPFPDRDFHQAHPRDLLPPPTKLRRRESEPYSYRSSYTSNNSKLATHETIRNTSFESMSGLRRRSAGCERGFHGSTHAMSLMHSHRRKDSFHRRTS